MSEPVTGISIHLASFFFLSFSRLWDLRACICPDLQFIFTFLSRWSSRSPARSMSRHVWFASCVSTSLEFPGLPLAQIYSTLFFGFVFIWMTLMMILRSLCPLVWRLAQLWHSSGRTLALLTALGPALSVWGQLEGFPPCVVQLCRQKNRNMLAVLLCQKYLFKRSWNERWGSCLKHKRKQKTNMLDAVEKVKQRFDDLSGKRAFQTRLGDLRYREGIRSRSGESMTGSPEPAFPRWSHLSLVTCHFDGDHRSLKQTWLSRSH